MGIHLGQYEGLIMGIHLGQCEGHNGDTPRTIRRTYNGQCEGHNGDTPRTMQIGQCGEYT